MLKRIAKAIRHNLLKVNFIRREVDAYKLEQHHLAWELILSGKTLRECEDEIDVVSRPPSIVRPMGIGKWRI